MDKVGGKFCFLWFWFWGSMILSTFVGGFFTDIVFEAIQTFFGGNAFSLVLSSPFGAEAVLFGG